jgi:hypothetical protein
MRVTAVNIAECSFLSMQCYKGKDTLDACPQSLVALPLDSRACSSLFFFRVSAAVCSIAFRSKSGGRDVIILYLVG